MPNEGESEEFPKVKASHMLMENLRERCLYEMADEYDDEDSHVFLNYLYNMRVSCLEKSKRVYGSCSEKVMHRLSINVESVRNCMGYQKSHSGTSTNMSEFFESDR